MAQAIIRQPLNAEAGFDPAPVRVRFVVNS